MSTDEVDIAAMLYRLEAAIAVRGCPHEIRLSSSAGQAGIEGVFAHIRGDIIDTLSIPSQHHLFNGWSLAVCPWLQLMVAFQ